MSAALTLRQDEGRAVEIAAGGRLLWRYVYAPDTPLSEARRPYAHPVCAWTGEVLTNLRPNDHPWHHALSLTLTRVDDVNFWGGPSYRSGDGYKPRDDQGEQRHTAWTRLSAEHLEESLDWCDGRAGQPARVLLRERRTLQTMLLPDGWSLRWTSELTNATGGELSLGNYHSAGGLAGSHYTGLQFRGARELLDEHGDAAIGVRAEGDLAGEAAVHGAPAHWMEWRCQHDGTLRRTRVRFENLDGPLPWFVRTKNPLAAFAFHRERPHALPAGATLRLDHLLTFTSL